MAISVPLARSLDRRPGCLAKRDVGAYRLVMSKWNEAPRNAQIKTIGYAISVVSVILLAIVSWKNASTDPILALCLFGGASTSILGMGLRWWSYEIEKTEKRD